jgi:hypothetical protein
MLAASSRKHIAKRAGLGRPGARPECPTANQGNQPRAGICNPRCTAGRARKDCNTRSTSVKSP